MKEATKTLRVLPADVYDALELSALAFGGIGADHFGFIDGQPAGHNVSVDPRAIPCCIHGHALSAERTSGEMRQALFDVEINFTANDDAVGNGKRISFPTWCKRLNVVRGS